MKFEKEMVILIVLLICFLQLHPKSMYHPDSRKSVPSKKGEPVVIKIPFTGNPKPTVKWVRDGVEIKGRNYVQEVTERHAVLTIKEATKEDDGPYRLTLENELGTDSAVIKIQINGEPHFNTIASYWTF